MYLLIFRSLIVKRKTMIRGPRPVLFLFLNFYFREHNLISLSRRRLYSKGFSSPSSLDWCKIPMYLEMNYCNNLGECRSTNMHCEYKQMIHQTHSQKNRRNSTISGHSYSCNRQYNDHRLSFHSDWIQPASYIWYTFHGCFPE